MKKKTSAILTTAEKKVIKQKKIISTLCVLLLLSVSVNAVYIMDIKIPFLNQDNMKQNTTGTSEISKDNNILNELSDIDTQGNNDRANALREELTEDVIVTDYENVNEAFLDAYDSAVTYEMVYSKRPSYVTIFNKPKGVYKFEIYDYATDENAIGGCIWDEEMSKILADNLTVSETDGLLDLIQAEGNEFKLIDCGRFVDEKGRKITFNPDVYIEYDFKKIYPTANWDDIVEYCEQLVEKHKK